ncbi:aldehyde dehydrogenase family protein [Fimbriimonas ginsengisoli]|nr:aldehyde dehydrogenase family protein [Fimbriimonas ginsengisoli]
MVHCELLIDGFFVGGPCDQSVGKQVVRAPFDNAILGTAAEGGLSELKACVDAAHSAYQSWRESPRHLRQALLRRIAALVREREAELVELLTLEVGKPIVWSRGEVARLALTFDYAADILGTYGLEAIPVDTDARGEGLRCTVERFPIGVIFCIVPYNWPYNLTAHKLAPALASGNTVVVKPSPLAPLSTLTLMRLIHEAGCPPGVVNAWNGPPALAQRLLVEDPRIRMLSFTGSVAVGWKLKELLPDRRVLLELGGDASAIVHGDADLEWAAARSIAGGFGYAGQICISIQHVLVQSSIYDAMRSRLIAATESCRYGEPLDEATVCGPMISNEAADRVQQMIDEAVGAGATIIAGGGRQGRLLRPVLLENVQPGTRLAHEEVFGPVLTLSRYETIDEAIVRVNESPYGIQTGIFTHSLAVAERAFRRLDVGGVIVNDYPTLRFDNMPYGGNKRSGFGREGVRYAMDEMTESKTMLVRPR